ncbi:hypothetical protein C6P42_001167 [Pichia californica]|nr:hypothetical protein C6P42_001167 [[Candida] californica]
MGIIGGTFKLLYKTTFTAASFGLGFAIFARPWPDTPLLAKPMELVQDKQIKDKENSIENYEKLDNYSEFINCKIFSKYVKDENFKLIPTDKLIPEAHRYNQVSQGLMELNNPIIMINKEDGELVLFGKSNNSNLIGLDGKIHNGIILTLLDESLCFCGFNKLPNKRGVTANLKVEFNDKLPTNSRFILSAKVVESRGRKVVIDGNLQSLDKNGKPQHYVANAKCLLVEPKWFKWFNWVDLF